MNPTPRRLLPALVGVLLAGASLAAAEPLLPADRSMAEVIDQSIDAKLTQAKVTAAPLADDPTLARRLYLDLAGRIPTAAEARAYATSGDPDKRAKFIDALMASPEYVHHNANEFDQLLRCDHLEAPSVRPYLLVAFRENRPWDRMFRELLGVSPDPAKPEQFVLHRLKDTDMVVRDVSSVFFGLNLSCAQCHRHPYIKSLSQDYFYGMKAFFARSYDFQGHLLERQHAQPVQYKAKDGAVYQVSPLFLNGARVEVPPAAVADLAQAIQEETKQIQELSKNYAKTKQLPPSAEFNLRAQLAELALHEDNREQFARALVNRLWYRFYGHGLVMRLDQMHAKNEPNHPELLAWLSRDFINHNYDLARLIRGLVSSQAYARSSRWDQEQPPRPELFAVASIRPLTAMQWGVSHRVASNPVRLKTALTDKLLDTLASEVQQSFGKLIEQPREEMQIGITEPMKLSNDAALLKLTGDQLVPLLLKLPDRRQQIEEAVWTVLSRPPTAQELRLLEAYLAQHRARPADAWQQLVWALFNSAEFRFNY